MLLIPLLLSLELVAWELCPVCSLIQDVHQAVYNLSFCCSQMLCLMSSAQMNMGFYLKYHRNLYFRVWSFKAFMWATWAFGCGTKACVSLADMNARWATATFTMILAIKYKKERVIMADSGGSQSSVRVYLKKSSFMRRKVFDCKATDSSYPDGTCDALHVKVTLLSVLCQTTLWTAVFQTLCL